MARVSGIQCDWCGKTAKLEGDSALPIAEKGWCHLNTVYRAEMPISKDLCPECAEHAHKALDKAEKRCRTGRTQR